MRWSIAVWISLAATLSQVAPARSGGLALPLRGVRALAMGGAFVAGADDPSALWVNPAQLAGLGGTRLLADAGIIGMSAGFSRTGGFDPVASSAPPLVDPSVFVSTDFRGKPFALGFGVFAPYGGHATFQYEGAQRYSLISNEGTAVLYVGLGAAWQPHRRFRVGFGFYNAIVNARFAKAASGQHILGATEDREWDLLAQFKMTSAFNPQIGFGLWGNPVGGLELGFSMHTPISVSGEGQLRLRPLLDNPNPTFDPSHQEGERARLSLELPLIARAGVRYNAAGRWDVEAAINYERWSTHRQITLQPLDVYLVDYPGIDRYRIKDQVFDRRWRDTLMFSLGGSAQLKDWVRVRGGYFYEPSAVPQEMTAVDAIDLDKHGIGLGATFTWRRLTIDVAYSHVFMMSRTVDASQVMQTNPIDPDRVTVVGNGTYTASYNIFGIAVGYRF
jgi:long-chain fatty acid transport protein